jgi:hypothetical protein
METELQQIPVKIQVIVSLIFIPLLALSLSKLGTCQELEKKHWNLANSAESRAASADHIVDDIESEIRLIQYNLETLNPKEARRIEDQQSYTRKNAIFAHQRGLITVEEANQRIDAVNARMTYLNEKEARDLKRLPELKAQLEVEKVKAEKEAERIIEEGKRSKKTYKTMENKGNNWGALMLTSVLFLFFFCTPFRWFIYFILAVCTLGAATKLFSK